MNKTYKWTGPLILVLSILIHSCAQKVDFALPPVTQTFGQKVTYNNKVDIIWVIDNSTSMQQHQNSMGAQVNNLIDRLVSLKMDYHMGVVTTTVGPNGEGGGFVGNSPLYYDAKNYQTSDQVQSLKSSFLNRVLQGENGGNVERGLGSLLTVLQANYLEKDAKGFYRDDALLVMIVLSDEDDQSSQSTNTYIHYFDLLKSQTPNSERKWIFNFVGVLENNSACKVLNESSTLGSRYMELVGISNGVQKSICQNDLTSAVSDIKARIESVLTEFQLDKEPDLATLKIWINGISVPRSAKNGWIYLEATNKIRFSGSFVPPADAEIKVDFKPANAD